MRLGILFSMRPQSARAHGAHRGATAGTSGSLDRVEKPEHRPTRTGRFRRAMGSGCVSHFNLTFGAESAASADLPCAGTLQRFARAAFAPTRKLPRGRAGVTP